MPLRDHFRPPQKQPQSWEELHGQWPAMIVIQLFKLLPDGYYAGPRVHPGSYFEIDVATFEHEGNGSARPAHSGNGNVAVAPWAPAQPTLTVEADLPEPSEYEVLVFDENRGRRLVAAIEIVSPSNKDRPENRQAFVGKCSAMLKKNVCVSIVDLVTIRHANLYSELVEQIGRSNLHNEVESATTYAASCRTRRVDRRTFLDTWPFSLEIGRPLPTLPLWLSEDLAIPLDLEASYEETCKFLRIP